VCVWGGGGKTPYELWIGSKPSVSHFRTFGCIAHVKVTKPNLKKLDDRNMAMIFVGYESGSTTYRCYDPHTKSVLINRDVVFDEDASWNWTGVEVEILESDFSVEGYTEEIQTTETEWRLEEHSDQLHDERARKSSRGTSVTPVSRNAVPPSAEMRTTPLSAEESPLTTPSLENLYADHDKNGPLKLRRLIDIIGPGTPPG
jgi:hypothetical protein